MVKKTFYASIGAAALAVDFVTHPRHQQNWINKAEKRGGEVAKTGQRRLRPVTRRVESALDEIRSSSMSAIGQTESKAREVKSSATATATRTARTARKNAPRVRVSRARTRAGSGTRGRKVQRTTLSVTTPASS